MKKIVNYVIAYVMWIIDIGLALWLFIISRSALLNYLGLFYKINSPQYEYTVGFIDKIFSIIVGLGWLAFLIFTEQYFRKGAQKGSLLRPFAKVTGSVMLGIFVVNLILLWLAGVGSSSLLSWLILAVELGVGIGLLVLAKTGFAKKST
jgi:hypothetical protein